MEKKNIVLVYLLWVLGLILFNLFTNISPNLWNILMYIDLILSTSLCMYLAHSYNHKVMMWILGITFFITIFFEVSGLGLITWIYLIFLAVTHLFKKEKPNNE